MDENSVENILKETIKILNEDRKRTYILFSLLVCLLTSIVIGQMVVIDIQNERHNNAIGDFISQIESIGYSETTTTTTISQEALENENSTFYNGDVNYHQSE